MTAVTGWGLLRIAGLPVQMWLAAGSPELFAALRKLDQLESDRQATASALAVDIGKMLVPQPRLEPSDRHHALACRRRLHQSLPTSSAQLARLAGTCQSLGLVGLADQIELLAELSENVRIETERAEADVAAAHSQLRPLPWMLLTRSAVGRRALLDGCIKAADDITRRLTAGDSWDGKRLRQRSGYLWRMIARGAMKTTPRGWLSHVALVAWEPYTAEHVDDAAPRVADDAAAYWAENLHDVLGDRSSVASLSGDTVVGMTPLHVVSSGRLRAWTVEPSDPPRLRSADVRLTPPLLAARAALAHGARPARDVVAAMAMSPQDEQQRAALFEFLAALIRLDVLQQTVRRPASRRTGWRGLSGQPEPLAPSGSNGFLDVHRRISGRWPAPDLEMVSGAVEQALRLTALMQGDHPENAAWMSDVTTEPRPVVTVMADHLDRDRLPPPRHAVGGWRPAQDGSSGYARLLDWIAMCADSGASAIDLTEAVLDSCGAPRRMLTWPVDCTVRPLTRDGVYLDTVGPAAVVDARFAAELTALHGRIPAAEPYRDFLRHLDAATGVPSVELLVPPLSERAANAVRRLLYPRQWTGDPDLTRYCPTAPDARYLPLSRLTVRRSNRRLVVEADQAAVRVLYHATRTCPPPWNVLSRLLLSGTPQSQASTPRLRHPLRAFPRRAHLPRLTLAGVVVAGAQWRLDPADLWAPGTSDLDKLRHLTRLRDWLEWPRWVFLSAYPWVRPVPCDLDSVHAVTVIEDVLAVERPVDTTEVDASVLVEEALPTPDQAVLPDNGSGGHLATELLLRLPSGFRPAELAELAAAPSTTDPEGRAHPLEYPVGKGGD